MVKPSAVKGCFTEALLRLSAAARSACVCSVNWVFKTWRKLEVLICNTLSLRYYDIEANGCDL